MKDTVRICFLLTILAGSFLMWLNLDHNPVSTLPQSPTQTVPEAKTGEKTSQMVHIKRQDGSTVDVELEAYLVGVVASEMSADFPLEALKAQAVAARTFVAQRQFTVDDTVASQVYQDDSQLLAVWGTNYDEKRAKIATAVAQTEGKVIRYQGELITAAFFSSCAGATNNSEDYWQNAVPYLRSVASPWDEKIDGYRQEANFTHAQLAKLLGFQQPIQTIAAPQRYDNGYVKSVVIDGIQFTGREIREALSLRSSAFTISEDGDQVIFTTQGFGHGIGMSQYGAAAMADEGSDYEEILKHYYQGVEINSL